MQNHQPYTGKYNDLFFEVEGAADTLEAQNYMNDLYYSDLAIADFLSKLDSFDEKTVVIFWGDHLPGMYGDEIYMANGKMKMRETPFLVYSNFNLVTGDVGVISPIYFINYVHQISGTPVSPFTALLMELEEYLPAFEKGMYLETESNEYQESREDLDIITQSLLAEYDLIMYDITSGKNYSKELAFSKIEQ